MGHADEDDAYAVTRVDWAVSLVAHNSFIFWPKTVRDGAPAHSHPDERRWLNHLMPKKLEPLGRPLILLAYLGVARVRLRLEARLEPFEERLRPIERIDDRDDGMPYTYDAENKFADKKALRHLVKRAMDIQEDGAMARVLDQLPHFQKMMVCSAKRRPSVHHLLRDDFLLHHGYAAV